jgi:hypothetical protein
MRNQMASQTHDQLKQGWYLEDNAGLLPVGPFASLDEANKAAAEIGAGRPVYVTEPKNRDHPSKPEPQEMTLGRLRCPEDRHEWATNGGLEYCLYCGGR